jgi:hypothetical protein
MDSRSLETLLIEEHSEGEYKMETACLELQFSEVRRLLIFRIGDIID